MNRQAPFTTGLLIFALALLAACQPVLAGSLNGEQPAVTARAASAVPQVASPAPTASLTPAAGTAAPAPAVLRVWLSPGLPSSFKAAFQPPPGVVLETGAQQASLQVSIGQADSALASTAWIYALAAPFPTLSDSVSSASLHRAWQGEQPAGALKEGVILVSAETRGMLEAWWGPAGAARVQTVAEDRLLESAWQAGPGKAWAILPFESLQPRWKVLRVNGASPLDKGFDPRSYALSVPIQLVAATGDLQAAQQAARSIHLPPNRDPARLTTLVLTGVTALSRQTAERMATEGATYPGRDIGAWLKTADLAHISNEVSFNPQCPPPGPARRDMRFCSAPENIELLESLGTDIVELTGNHILDWGFEPFIETLAMYQQRGWQVYGGGANLSAARQTLQIEHNGNRLAFIGCSPAGPPNVWATVETPGSAPCDWSELETRIAGLRQQGWLPVVTLQAVETDGYLPAVAQSMPNFRRLASAGAVVVSGSQSHYPQTMTFVNDSFVHYGLGNLFFDQMDLLATRQGFVDRHVFYDGRYLGVELLTTLIEDYARPRPMTANERSTFLNTIFSLSQWHGN